MSRPLAPKKGWLAYYSGLIGTWAKGNSLSCEAEDAVQESVIQFLGKDPAAVLNPKAYLLRSSRNRLINEIKRRSRTELISLEELAHDDHPLLSDPETSLRAGELAQALEAALAQLPLKKRQAFIYHRLEGYTQPEIAEKMGLALNTVERYVMDATRHARTQLQSFCPEYMDTVEKPIVL
ncbi:RNA polymerase sigma factor [Pusillimonas sp. SM2304]|uniref:RNA polymerase sigma factor n=1 Tax=Pusillimonas sp. SM2304 TaxID=3073241 RepID=UPI0028767678|nr:RNA polymerase sigma factor [Pusillimonas sp. SM2304]MDS1138983.1 RNA polymerase sigma factor [Pusillimonas sp. SM2304]